MALPGKPVTRKVRVMAVVQKSRLGRLATIGGAAAVVLLVPVFFLPNGPAAAWLFTVAFLVAAAAIVLAAVARLRSSHARPTAKPTSVAGWWALGLAAGGFLLTGAVPAIVTAVRPEFEGPVPSLSAFFIAGFAAMIAGGIAAAVGWFRRGERSLIVLLTVFPALFALYFVIGEFAFPH